MKSAQTDYSVMKLGKKPPVYDPRTLNFANYLHHDLLPRVPQKHMYAGNIAPDSWGMMGNHNINNCTCAAAGHLIMEWTDDNGNMVTLADQDIINLYSTITGYDPATGQNDTGADEKLTLNYWRNNGVSGHKILAYTALEPKNNHHVKQAVYLFGGCMIGLNLPFSAQMQNIWSVLPGGPVGDGLPGTWGGHAMAVIGYDHEGLTAVTWGEAKKMTWSFYETYFEEAYAIISTDFVGKKAAPNGFKLAELQADLQKINS